MRSLLNLFIVFALATAIAGAQPSIASTGVVNSASYMSPGLPGSGIAQGSIFAIEGTGLGPATVAPAPGAFPLPTSIEGTSVNIQAGGVSTPAILLYAYQYQVGAILPSTIPVGDAEVTVTYNGKTSKPVSFKVVASAFGVFTFNQGGSGQAVADDTNYQANSIIHTFHPGDTVILWGTGIGAIKSSDGGAPPTGNIGDAQVFVGNSQATVSYHGRSGCCAGVDQIVFEVPSGVEGCYVPIGVQAGGAMSNITTIAVSSSGNTCSDSIVGSDLISELASGGTVGFAYIRLEEGLGGDLAFGSFSQYTPATAGFAEYGVSPGYCSVCNSGSPLCNGELSDLSSPQMNAGTQLTVDGFGRTVPVPNEGGGFYFAVLNASDGSRYLWTGLSYTVAGTGGSQVGNFSVTDKLNSNAPLIASPAELQVVPLSQDLTVQWTGGSGTGILTIGGISFINSTETQFVAFQCAVPASGNQFTIPKWVLSTLPPSAFQANGNEQQPLGFIWIGQYDTPVEFQATGLDRGIVTNIFFLPREVQYQ